MGKSINGEDLGKGYYQKANGLYYAKRELQVKRFMILI